MHSTEAVFPMVLLGSVISHRLLTKGRTVEKFDCAA